MPKVPAFSQKGDEKPYTSANKGVGAPRAEGHATTSHTEVLHATVDDETEAAKPPVQRYHHG